MPYACIGGLVSFFAGLRFLHRLPWRTVGRRRAFCDKLCVHQTCQLRKKAGMDSFAGFIGNSRELVVLWSKGYFHRLWCTFEIATFLHYYKEREKRGTPRRGNQQSRPRRD